LLRGRIRDTSFNVDALTSVLQMLGAGLGADVWLTGIRCDGEVLAI
jgi:hypothetical protein